PPQEETAECHLMRDVNDVSDDRARGHPAHSTISALVELCEIRSVHMGISPGQEALESPHDERVNERTLCGHIAICFPAEVLDQQEIIPVVLRPREEGIHDRPLHLTLAIEVDDAVDDRDRLRLQEIRDDHPGVFEMDAFGESVPASPKRV